MKTIKIERKQSEKQQKELYDNGYIGRNTVTNKEYKSKFNIPEYAILRKMAESKQIDSIKVITNQTSTYWFKKKDIESMFIEKTSNIRYRYTDEEIKAKCPYTLAWARSIWQEGFIEAMNIFNSKVKFNIEYAKKEEKLDSMIPQETYYNTNIYDNNYTILK